MRLLYFGDVVGRSGRDALVAVLPDLRRRLDLDFVVVNGENAAGGFGITGKICAEFYAAGVDVVTLGNHSWDQRETLGYIDGDPRLLRPQNYPRGTPGRGAATFTTRDDAPHPGRRVAVIHVMGRLFMDPLDDPFAIVAGELAKLTLGGTVDAVLVDIHAEATSEKMAMGHFCDGRVSLVVGSHSHVPTADAQILSGGTAYQSDAGMCGDYNSVIGMNKAEPLTRFTRKIASGRMSPADGPGTICGVFVETDPRTGLARHIAPLRQGPRLAPAWPLDVMAEVRGPESG